MLIMDAPKTPKPLALLTGTQLPSFHSHKLVPTSDKSPESPTTSDELKSAALSNEVSNTNSSLPSYTTAVFN